MPLAKTLEFVAELIEFIAELASGGMTIEKARKRAAELLARKPEHFTDELLAELEAKIENLEHVSER